MLAIGIEALLPSAHRLIVELSALLLQLVITNIESISAQAMISVAHSHLILLLAVQMVHHLVVVLVVIIDAGAARVRTICIRIVIVRRFSNVHTIVSLVVTVPIQSVVLICIYLI